LQDPDLKALRERREWLSAIETAKGGVSTKAQIRARTEAKAPFRAVRLFVFGGLGAGAALGLFIITGRLIAALKGERKLHELLLQSCLVRRVFLHVQAVAYPLPAHPDTSAP